MLKYIDRINDSLILNNKTNIEVRVDLVHDNRSLYAKKSFIVNEVISYFNWEVVFKNPSYLTIQIGENQHVELLPKQLECVNHSCSPNAFFDTTNKCLVCIEAIDEGEEINFFYPSSEWDMGQAFNCKCNTSKCIGSIKGAKYLTEEQRKLYKFTDFIQLKMTESKNGF